MSFLNKTKKLLPIVIVMLIAWLSYNCWLNCTPSKITLSNSIEAKDVKISSKVTGRVSKIYVEEGDKVKKGQKLLELEGDEYVAQLLQARASLRKSQSDLSKLIKGARPQEINSAIAETMRSQALLEEAKSTLENTTIEYNRIKELNKNGAISTQLFDKTKTQRDIAEKELQNFEQANIKAKENEKLVKEGSRKEEINSAKALVAYYKAKVIEQEKYTKELIVIAPFDGEISSFDLHEGEILKASQPILTITDLSDIYVRVYIPEKKLSDIKNKQKILVKADGFPNDSFEGYITYIGAQAEYTPRNIQTAEERSKLVYSVKIRLNNKENKLRNGMYVTVQL